MRNATWGRFVIGLGLGAAIGVATGQFAVWFAIGAGLGMVFSHRSLRRAC